jgi:Bacterial lipid A biosynthesis acyltransferase
VAAHHRRGPRARDADDKGAPLSFGYANKSGWIVGFRRVLHQASQVSEAAVVLTVMMAFACLPIDWASALGGYIGRLIGPRLGVSRRALGNLRRAMPENSDGENRRIPRRPSRASGSASVVPYCQSLSSALAVPGSASPSCRRSSWLQPAT